MSFVGIVTYYGLGPLVAPMIKLKKHTHISAFRDIHDGILMPDNQSNKLVKIQEAWNINLI